MLRPDFLGYMFDDANGPNFIILPNPPHPLDQDGLYKFVLHRPTQKLFDRDDMLAKMHSQGYTPDALEWGFDNEWLRQNMGYPIPYEYTLTIDPTKSWSWSMYFTLTGPATATERVWVEYGVKKVDNIWTPYEAFVNRNTGFWIEPGMSYNTVRGLINATDLSDTAYNGEPYPIVGDDYRRVMNTLATGSTSKDVTIRGQVFGGWLIDQRFAHRLSPIFSISGMNLVWDGVPAVPKVKIEATLDDIKETATILVTGGPVPDRAVPGLRVEIQSIICQGIPILSTGEPRWIETTIPEGSDDSQIADALVTWLNGKPLYHQGALVTGYVLELTRKPILGYPSKAALMLKVKDTTLNAYVPMDFAPYFNCY